jgi:hypothetical protein
VEIRVIRGKKIIRYKIIPAIREIRGKNNE